MECFCKISFNKGKVRRQVLGLIVLGYGCGSIFSSLILIAPFGSSLEWTGHGPSPMLLYLIQAMMGFLPSNGTLKKRCHVPLLIYFLHK